MITNLCGDQNYYLLAQIVLFPQRQLLLTARIITG